MTKYRHLNRYREKTETKLQRKHENKTQTENKTEKTQNVTVPPPLRTAPEKQTLV